MTINKNHNDLELAVLLKSYDNTAYKVIFKKYWADVFCFAKRSLHSDEISAALVQELFAQLWVNAGQITLSSGWKDYLIGTARTRLQHYKTLREFQQLSAMKKDTYSTVSDDYDYWEERIAADLPLSNVSRYRWLKVTSGITVFVVTVFLLCFLLVLKQETTFFYNLLNSTDTFEDTFFRFFNLLVQRF